MPNLNRKQVFVDAKVQGALLLRAVLYWLMCLLSITLMVLCWRIVTGPARLFYTHFDDMWFHFGPAVVASFLMLPLVMFDLARIGNRIAGPMVRMRASLRALARGEDVAPIKFRRGDFWQECAEEFNALVARLESEKRWRESLDGERDEFVRANVAADIEH